MADSTHHTASSNDVTRWRATGEYATTSIATAGLLPETLIYLRTYAGVTGDVATRAAETRRRLVEGALPQRSRATRLTFAKRLNERLATWNPPAWVLDDLVRYTQEDRLDALRAALLVHVCRQDFLLYTIVERLIFARWQAGERLLPVADVHRLFDDEAPAHPEIARWAYATRNRLASNTLSTLRDYGLLRGANQKEIVEPIVPPDVVQHLHRLLAAEGLAPAEIVHHPDWKLWLWRPQHVAAALEANRETQETPR
jgi:hypothetical protein